MTERALAVRLYEHALHWQRIGEFHPAFRDPALINDLKEAAKILMPEDDDAHVAG
jgi:hypothetical protein